MYLRFILFFAPSAGHIFMHGLVVSFYFYHSGSCVEYAATFFAAELVNVVRGGISATSYKCDIWPSIGRGTYGFP